MLNFTRESSRRYQQNGATLVELMLAVALSLFVLAGMTAILTTSLKRSNENLQIIRLNQEMRAVMDIMAGEIQRAGYSGTAYNDVGQNTNTNAFMDATTNLSVPNTSCILFSYDKNSDGAPTAINTGTDDERYGYRLNAGAIQSRPVNAAFNCGSTNIWQDLTDKNVITINNLTFTPTLQPINLGGTARLTIREVAISITGSLTSDATMTRTITQAVRVQNDVFSPT